MASDLVKARWNGPFDAQLGVGEVLKPGEEYEVTPEDLKSSHWIAVGKDAKQIEAENQKAIEAQVEAVNTDPEPPADPTGAEDS
jgi:hypothetical protein